MDPKGCSDTKIAHTIRDCEELFKDVECPKNFQCYKSDFAKAGKVRAQDSENFLECLEESADQCEFSLPCVDKYFCLCPVRIHIANKLNI